MRMAKLRTGHRRRVGEDRRDREKTINLHTPTVHRKTAT
jgi:hypothetical protein